MLHHLHAELSDESITGAPEDCRPGIGRVFAGERATILIQLLAYPCPNVTWMVNGTELDLANNMLQIPNNPCSNGTTGTYKFTLTITNVTQGFGNYSAYLKNRAGNITTDVILITPEGIVCAISSIARPFIILQHNIFYNE